MPGVDNPELAMSAAFTKIALDFVYSAAGLPYRDFEENPSSPGSACVIFWRGTLTRTRKAVPERDLLQNLIESAH